MNPARFCVATALLFCLLFGGVLTPFLYGASEYADTNNISLSSTSDTVNLGADSSAYVQHFSPILSDTGLSDSMTTGMVADSTLFEISFIDEGHEASASDLLLWEPGVHIQHYGAYGQGERLLLQGIYVRADEVLIDGLPALVPMSDYLDCTLIPWQGLRSAGLKQGDVSYQSAQNAPRIPFIRVTYQASNFLPLIPLKNYLQQAGVYGAWHFLSHGNLQGYYRSITRKATQYNTPVFDEAITTHLGVAADYLFNERWFIRGALAESYQEHSASVPLAAVKSSYLKDITSARLQLKDNVLGMRLNQGLLAYINQPYWETATPFGYYTGMQYTGKGIWEKNNFYKDHTIALTTAWQYERMLISTQLREQKILQVGGRYALQPLPALRLHFSGTLVAMGKDQFFEPVVHITSLDSAQTSWSLRYDEKCIIPTLTELYGSNTFDYYEVQSDSTLPVGRQRKVWGTIAYHIPSLTVGTGVFFTAIQRMLEPVYIDTVSTLTTHNDIALAGVQFTGEYRSGPFSLRSKYDALLFQSSQHERLLHRPQHSGRLQLQYYCTYKYSKVHWTNRMVVRGQSQTNGHHSTLGQTVHLPAFLLADITTMVRIMDIRLTYTMENCMNTKYAYFYGFTMPGRTHRMTVDWDFWN